jgi:hypothetical protein
MSVTIGSHGGTSTSTSTAAKPLANVKLESPDGGAGAPVFFTDRVLRAASTPWMC